MDSSLLNAHPLAKYLPFRKWWMWKIPLEVSYILTSLISVSSAKRSINAVLPWHHKRMNAAMWERRNQKPMIPLPYSVWKLQWHSIYASYLEEQTVSPLSPDTFGSYCISEFFCFKTKLVCKWWNSTYKLQHFGLEYTTRITQVHNFNGSALWRHK